MWPWEEASGTPGTTGAALRTGKPTMICPFLGDQPFWGNRVHSLGVGPKPIPHKRLSVSNLTSALHEMTHSATMRDRAERIGRLIRAEDGVKSTVRAIEGVLQRYGVGRRRP